MQKMLSLIFLVAFSAFAVPAVYNIKKLNGWTPIIDGSLSEWPEVALIDSIRSDSNVFARTSPAPWTRSEIQFKVYAAYDDNKVYFAVKVIADNNVIIGSRWYGDNLKVNPGGQAAGFYVSTDGATYRNPNCPYALNVSFFTALSMTWNPGFPCYEFAIEKSMLDPFYMGRFQLSVGSDERDADSSVCYLGLGVEYTGNKQAWSQNPWDNPLYYPIYILDTTHVDPIPTNLPTHVFWYNGKKNRCNLAELNPGPGLSSYIILHEGMAVTGSITQHSGAQSDNFNIGSGLDDVQGRCSFIWSKDLNEMTGSVSNAVIRGEYKDGWSGSALCNAGPIAIRCGVVDYSGNVNVWGGIPSVPCNAIWQDFLNPLGSSMGYNDSNPQLQAEEIINMTAPSGRSSAAAPSVLDGRFFELPITNQVNWILAHPGQHAIVFLVTPGQGSTGKIHLYSDECASSPGIGSDMPWTADGNTMHIIARGGLTYTTGAKMLLARDSLSNSTAYFHLSDVSLDTVHLTRASVSETLPEHVKLVNLNLQWNVSLDSKIDSARLAIPYTDSMLVWAHAAPDTSLRIGYFNGTSWVLLPTSLQTINRRVSATITSKGYYALFVDYIPPNTLSDLRPGSYNKPGFSMAPNPASSVVLVTAKGLDSPYKLELINVQGRVIASMDGHASKQTSFNLTGMPNGVYLLRITCAKMTECHLLIKI